MGRLDLRDPHRDEDFESGIEVVHRQQSEDVSLAASLRERGRGAGRVDATALSAPRDRLIKLVEAIRPDLGRLARRKIHLSARMWRVSRIAVLQSGKGAGLGGSHRDRAGRIA